MSSVIDLVRQPIGNDSYVARCREELEAAGALVLDGFFPSETLATVLEQSEDAAHVAYFTDNTHNVFLSPNNPELPDDHVFNRQIVSTKGCITHDQIVDDSPLREVYESPAFRRFLQGVLGIDQIHSYADDVSSINVHFHHDGHELGWHFDNSSFAVTMLIQAPESGGVFEYIPQLRDAEAGDMNFEGVESALAGGIEPRRLDFDPGALVLFRGRDSMHRVTPSRGNKTRVLVVFAYNTRPGVGLSDSAKTTFYGRTSAARRNDKS